MADATGKTAKDAITADIPLPPAPAIAFGATSYDFNALNEGVVHAETLKTEKGRDEALARAQATAQKAPLRHEAVSLPPGTAIQTVEDANGREVEAAVHVVDEGDSTVPSNVE